MKTFLYIFKRTLIAIFFATSVTLMAQIPLPSIALEQPVGGEQWTRGGTYLISWMDNFNGNVDALYKYKFLTPHNHDLYNGTLTYDETVSVSDIVIEFDAEHVFADWNDLETISDVDAWILAYTMGWVDGDKFWVTNVGDEWNIIPDPDEHFYIEYNSVDPGGSLDNIDSKIWLLSDATHLAMYPVLARKTWSDYTAFTPGAGVTGTTTYWDTDGLPLTKYKIKVQSHNAPTMYYDETGEFSLVYQQDGVIELIQPNGGEVWAKGTTHKISWTDNLDEPVKIELYNGTTWSTIKASTTASTWDWPITQDAGTLYKIRISSTVSGATTAPDISAATFTITAGSGINVEVLQPNDLTIYWAMGTKHLISWNDDFAEPVDVYYKKAAGPEVKIGDQVLGTTMVWTIPTTLGFEGDYQIIVRSQLSGIEDSGLTFHVTKGQAGTIDVLQPDDITLKWAKGTKHLISWNDDLIETVDIYYVDQFNTETLIQSDVVGTTYAWTIPNMTGDYRIRVKSHLDPTLYQNTGVVFEVTASAGNEVTVIQPSIDGIEWQYGTEHLISWTDDFDENVKIELYSADGLTLIYEIDPSVWGSTYTWNINNPLAVIGVEYKIKISSTIDGIINDFSDFSFEIVGSTGTYIDVLQPDGGEIWWANQSYYISWDDDFLEGVNIYLYKAGVQVGLNAIKENAIGSTWVWPIPLATTAGTDYKIKIESVNDPTNLFDFSFANFEIVPYVMLNAYPNPANQSLTLQINDPTGQQCQVSIYNRFNAEVYSTSVNTGVFNTLNIPTGDLPNGIYFINVTSNTSNVSRKIIINH